MYDSLLRAVAAGAPSVRIDSEVGPDGKFVLQQEIGSGAMGRVYRALDRYLLRDVAIKFILRPEGMNHDDFMALFWQEAHIIARLDQHDNIVRIFDVDRSTYPPFLVMEYLDGQSLETMLRSGPVDMQTAFRVMIAAACGLREAHAKGVYHRDLKPSNIFVQKTGRVKLLDFGLARIRNHFFETSTTKARFMAVHSVPALASAGTPAYMSPEQWRGEDADTATDLWAMGAILYRLLARVPPFDGESLAALSERVLSGRPPAPLAQLCPEAPAEVCALVERMLRFERSGRPGSAAEVIAALEAGLRAISRESHPGPSAFAAPAVPASVPNSAPWSAASTGQRFAHGSGPDSPVRYWEKMLLVLVSGTESGTDTLPERLSTWLLHNAGVNFEIWHCPPLVPGDVAGSAARLRAAFNERFKRPRHIFFIAVGEGTAVVLRMLLDEARRLRPSDGGKIELDVRSPFYRTRHVAMLRPGRGGATAHPAAGAPVGAIGGLDATPGVAEVMAEAQRFLAATLPTPMLHEFGIDDDRAQLSSNSLAVQSLASFLVRPEMLLARETIAQTFELDCAARISSLVEPIAGAGEEVVATVPGADGASQAEVFEELVAAARAQHQRPMVMVIAGDAGVGKSTVLRMAARRLSSEFVASSDGTAALPVLIPLYFASLSSEHLAALGAESAQDRRGRVLRDILLDWWCGWSNDITYAEAFGVDWVKARLRSEPTVLMFDGIDEFIANHPAVSISDFQQMVALLGAECRQNGWLTIVLGVRSTQPGLPLLASSNIREILQLTTAQAMRQFPATSAWLSAASDAPTKLLFTPLILAQLNTRRPPSNLRPSTHGDVVLLALTTIIEQSDLCGKLDERGRTIDAQRWIDALMAVAWCLFRRLRGEIATSALKFDGADLHRSWADHLEATQQQAQGERLLSGFHLLCESRACDALLYRTILYPTGRGEIRFIHREWQDFLAARYLAQVVMYRHVDEFRHVGNTARISRMAGELLCQAGVCIDEALVRTLLRHARETGASLGTANFSALVTNSRILIEGPAIDAFLSAVHTMPPVARCITLIGLGYRALRGDDASAHDLRSYLVRVFRNYLSAAIEGEDLGVMRSVAWCYLKSYEHRFGGPRVTEPWPGLDAGAERGALAMMCSTTGDGPRFSAEHRSVQMALLEVQQVVADDPFRPVSGVHYLWCLSVARRHGAGIAELGRELPALLAAGSRYATAIEQHEAVPEVREILAACRRLAL
ncbi:MAG TPA: protein kinase [Kofleriaceae bacterium]|nr:protein kinase [Kofleriaceae bacterium]